MKKWLTFFLFVCAFFYRAQNVDSLKHLLKTCKHDTTRLRLLVALSENGAEKEIYYYADWAVVVADKLLNKKELSDRKTVLMLKGAALNNLGITQKNNPNINVPLKYYKEGLALMQEAGDSLEASGILSNIGILYNQHGNIKEALNYLTTALKYQEAVSDTLGMADSFNTIASIYTSMGELTRAIEYCNKALKIEEAVRDTFEIAHCHTNLGAIYVRQKKHQDALQHYNLALSLLERIDYPEGEAYTLSNMGGLHQRNGNDRDALSCYYKSLAIHRQLENVPGMASAQFEIGTVYYSQSKRATGARKNSALKLAAACFDSSLAAARSSGYVEQMRDTEEKLVKTDSMRGDYKGAFNHYQQFIIYRDSLNNIETRKATIMSQLNYEFEKKEAVLKEQHEKELVITAEKNRIQKIITVAVGLCLLLVIAFAVYVWRSLKVTHRQKELIEEKQKEIVDSIRYARRIQRSLLTPERYIQKNISRLKQ